MTASNPLTGARPGPTLSDPGAAGPPRPGQTAPAARLTHLRAAAGAAVVAAVGLAAAHLLTARAAARHLPELLGANLPGQSESFLLPATLCRQPGWLPVYGSSELVRAEVNRADAFFRLRPTGFGVGLFGRPGETCLVVAQRLAALGRLARGRKVAVFLSPSWFVAPQLDPPGFAVNFSALQAGRALFGDDLDLPLKRRFARRWLAYPRTLARYPLLRAACLNLAAGAPARDVLFALLRPLGWGQNQVFAALDAVRLAAAWTAGPRPGAPGAPGAPRAESPPPAWERAATVVCRPGEPPRWQSWIRQLDRADARPPAGGSPYCVGPVTRFDADRQRRFVDPVRPGVSPDENYRRALAASREWDDLELLLATARHLGVDLLVVNQPVNVVYGRLQGVSDDARSEYYRRLRALAGRYGVLLRSFAAHGADPGFYADATHPSAKGWIYYDEVLDAFYHGTAPDPSSS